MRILISPYSAVLRSGVRNPKNFPYWAELVAKLVANGHEVLQIGVSGEDPIEGTHERIFDFPWDRLKDVFNRSDLFISVDNAIPHFVHCERLKPGIVIWGKSSPRIFGYPENENLWGGEQNLRPFQYKNWEEEPYDEKVFPSVSEIVWAVERRVKKPKYAGIF